LLFLPEQPLAAHYMEARGEVSEGACSELDPIWLR